MFSSLAQVSRAISIFSLAPLRYSANGPPFKPAECLRVGSTVEVVEKKQWSYRQGTRVRRWLVSIALWVGALFFVMAATLLAAGRQLQHRCVAVCAEGRKRALTRELPQVQAEMQTASCVGHACARQEPAVCMARGGNGSGLSFLRDADTRCHNPRLALVWLSLSRRSRLCQNTPPVTNQTDNHPPTPLNVIPCFSCPPPCPPPRHNAPTKKLKHEQDGGHGFPGRGMLPLRGARPVRVRRARPRHASVAAG